MVRHDLLQIQGILLHAHKVPHVAERALHDAIVVGRALELGTHELLHQLAGLGRIVRLSRCVSWRERGRERERERGN